MHSESVHETRPAGRVHNNAMHCLTQPYSRDIDAMQCMRCAVHACAHVRVATRAASWRHRMHAQYCYTMFGAGPLVGGKKHKETVRNMECQRSTSHYVQQQQQPAVSCERHQWPASSPHIRGARPRAERVCMCRHTAFGAPRELLIEAPPMPSTSLQLPRHSGTRFPRSARPRGSRHRLRGPRA